MSIAARHYDSVLSPVITEKTTIVAESFRGMPGRRKDIKKAIVTLKDGDSIDIATGL